MTLSFLDRYPKDPTVDELLAELRKFLAGSSKARATGDESAIQESLRTGLWLLRHLPVARDAVFDLISIVYEEFVQKYLQNLEEKGEGSFAVIQDEIEIILNEIHSTFLLYLEGCGEIWSPILSTWALHLLGHLSTRNATLPLFTRHQSVNEIITIWMGSKAIQSLLTLTSRCLTCNNHSNTDSFITALLDTSAEHSPHFDWVVAHVGNTYPQTVVTEVLGLGLTNFSATPPQASKLSSVGGILGHLSTTNSKEVQHAFDQMLQSVITSGNGTAQRFAIPYLLQLCSSSVPLLDVLMDSTLPKVKADTLNVLRPLITTWVPLHFGGNPNALVALVTHLILKSNRGPNALQILMVGCKTWEGIIGQKARTLLKHFMIEISNLLYESEAPHKELVKNFPCISALKENSDIIISFLTDSDQQLSRVAKQIVKLIAFYEGEAVGITALVYYFRNCQNDMHLWHSTNLVASLEMKYPAILSNVLKEIAVESGLRTNDVISNKLHLRPWKNLLRIIRSERFAGLTIRVKLSQVVRENLPSLVSLLDVRRLDFCMEVATLLVAILANVPDIVLNVRFGTLVKVERYLVGLLFKVLALPNRNEKIQHVSHISKLLHELSTTQAVQNDSLRSLVQSCLNPDCRHIFQHRNTIVKGRRPTAGKDYLADDDEFEPERFSLYVSLLRENQRRTTSVAMTRIHSTSFHSGKLAKSNSNACLNIRPKVQINENDDWDLNVKLFLSCVLAVCMAGPQTNGRNGENGNGNPIESNGSKKEPEVSVEAMRKVALLLVEIVSPDVMFNGLPWPEEEFSKVQVERDLQIRRAFEEQPYLWELLELVASYCPSLCYCSVLLRALMATFMAHWTSCQKTEARLYPDQLKWTIRLVNIMKTGQLIPPPLSYIGQVLSQLKSNEVLSLLRDIWWYMKANVPVPTLFVKEPVSKKFVRDAEFAKVDPALTEKLRLAILNNVETLGHLYPKLFPMQTQQAGN